MKIKTDYVLRKIGETWVVLPLAEETVNFSGMLTLNDSGAMLWNVLEKDCSVDAIVDALIEKYKISEELARQDAGEFLEKLISIGCIEQ